MKSYRSICESIDNAKSNVDIQSSVNDLELLGSFAAYYFLAELYRNGIEKSRNGTSLRLDKDEVKAIEYSKKAYQVYQQNGDEEAKAESKLSISTPASAYRLKVQIHGEDVSDALPHDAMNVDVVNKLLISAKKGNALSLFQLACFYHEELKVAENDSKRKISAVQSQLIQWIKCCLEAAAKLYHPHAAYMLLNEDQYSKHLTLTQKVELGFIAADPLFARSFDSASVVVHARGDIPLANPVVLFCPNVMPLELRKSIPISASSLRGLFANSVSSVGDCILPKAHEEFVKPAVLGAVSYSPLTPEQVRKLRAARFTLASKSSNSVEKNSDLVREEKASSAISKLGIA